MVNLLILSGCKKIDTKKNSEFRHFLCNEKVIVRTFLYVVSFMTYSVCTHFSETGEISKIYGQLLKITLHKKMKFSINWKNFIFCAVSFILIKYADQKITENWIFWVFVVWSITFRRFKLRRVPFIVVVKVFIFK